MIYFVAFTVYKCHANCDSTNLKYLKAINVKHTDAELFVRFLDGFIDGLEQTGRVIKLASAEQNVFNLVCGGCK